MNHVTIEKLSEDGLHCIRWCFYLLNSTLVVDSYAEMSRESRRHKFKIDQNWERLHSRNNLMRKAQVPLTPEVMAEAKAAYIEKLNKTITVGFQS